MSDIYYEFEGVDTFTTGAVGRPGERTFFLQARQARTRVAVKCEKQQVAAIAQHLRRVLNDLPPPEDRPVPAALELVEPVEQAFVLGAIGLGYDRSSDRLVVQLEEMVLVDEDGDELPGYDGRVRLYVTRGQAAAFCDHADRIVAAGRPDCRWCGLPIDPDGHPCPRMN
jgi:uncharacterized repeat protein (TIGR03847 family)